MKRSILLIAAYFIATSATAVEPTKPNIIVFYSDDHGYADLGIQGSVTDIRTPHLDALARSGVVAKNGYSTAPQCVPSRAGLLVGKFQGRFNLDSNGSALDGFNKETTIATRLQHAGYVTAQFGKWHLGATDEIPSHGFKHVFAQNAQRPFSANITLDGLDRKMSNLVPEMYHVDGCSRAAASVIERYKDSPFFLYVAYRAPHTPLDAPKAYTDRFPGKMPERRRQALAMISAMDDGVGLITSTLKQHGLTERTLIFFIGDNGAPLKIHKMDSPLNGDAGGWDGSLNDPLNGEKGMLAEGGMHVPFVIAWPGTIPSGQMYDHPVSALDVAATTADLVGVDQKPGDFDGVNLVQYLKGDIKTPPHEALYWRWTAQAAIRMGDWKLLRGGEREYLYNLQSDIEEKHNLALKHPEIAERLRTRLRTWTAELNPPGLALAPMAPTWNDYFDQYLEGKIVPVPTSKQSSPSDSHQGWTARNATLTENDGVLEVIPEKGAKGKLPFITQTQLKFETPVVAKVEMKASTAGQARFAWRTESQKDFLPENTVAFDVKSSNELQSYSVALPTTDTIIHVRLHLPQGTTWIRDIQFEPKSE